MMMTMSLMGAKFNSSATKLEFVGTYSGKIPKSRFIQAKSLGFESCMVMAVGGGGGKSGDVTVSTSNAKPSGGGGGGSALKIFELGGFTQDVQISVGGQGPNGANRTTFGKATDGNPGGMTIFSKNFSENIMRAPGGSGGVGGSVNNVGGVVTTVPGSGGAGGVGSFDTTTSTKSGADGNWVWDDPSVKLTGVGSGGQGGRGSWAHPGTGGPRTTAGQGAKAPSGDDGTVSFFLSSPSAPTANTNDGASGGGLNTMLKEDQGNFGAKICYGSKPGTGQTHNGNGILALVFS